MGAQVLPELTLPLASVHDCLRVPALRGSHVRGGHAGLDTSVRWVSAAATTRRCAPGEFRIVGRVMGGESVGEAKDGGAAAVAAAFVSSDAADEAGALGLPVIALPPGADLDGLAGELLDFVVASLDSTVVRLRQVSARLGRAACDDLRVEPLVETLAAVTGAPAVVTDPEHRLLWAVGAWLVDTANGVTALRLTAGLRTAYQRAAESDRPVRLGADAPRGRGLTRLVAPIAAGGETLGFCTVLLPEDGVGRQVAVVAVEQATHLLALALLRHRTADAGGRAARASLLVDLLAGGGDAELTGARAAAVGVALDLPVTVVVAVPPGSAPADGLTARVLAALPQRPVPLAGVVGSRVVAVVPGADRALALAAADAVAAAIGGGPAVAGRTVAVAGLPEAYREARRMGDLVARAAGPADRPVAVDIERLGLAGLLVEAAGEGAVDGFWRRRLAPLADYDAREGTDLCGSLTAFLRAQGLRPAARALRIHPNSLAYRLKRAEAIGGFSLADPDQRLEVELALRCRTLLGTP